MKSVNMRDFWKKEKVRNYLVTNLFDVDEIVRRFGGCPNDEDYKIIRSYYYIEFVGGEEPYEIVSTTKEDYEKYYCNENIEFDYRTELNYNDFIDKFWFDSFEQILNEHVEPDEQNDFTSCVEETFFELKSDGQIKIFLKEIVDGLNELSISLNFLSEKSERLNSQKVNSIQQFVLNLYSGSYQRTKNKIIEKYKSTYPDIEAETEYVTLGNDKNSNNKRIHPRNEIFKKLLDGTKNIERFEDLEKILVKENYLNYDLEWVKSASDFIRFYNYLEEKKIIKNTFVDCKGVRYLGDLFNYADFKTIESESKRKKQNTKKHYRQFHKILD